MKKKILYIVEKDISIDDGSSINERGLILELLKNPEIFVFIPKPQNFLNQKITKSPNLIIGTKLNRKNPISYLIFLIKKIKTILEISRSKEIGNLVFRWGPYPLDILYIGFFTKHKVFLKHLALLQSTQNEGVTHNIGAFFRKWVIKSNIIYGADTPSVMLKKIIEIEYKIKNILIAKNGTSHEGFTEVGRSKEFIYIGRLSKKRNTHKLLEVFKNSNRQLDIYGFGSMVQEVKEISTKYTNINYHGMISFDELKKELPYYKFGVDFTFVPTKYGKASFSQKISQYISFGINVIAIDCPDNYFIRDHELGYLVDLNQNDFNNVIDSIEYKKFIINDNVKQFIYNEEILKSRIDFWQS